MIVVTIFIILVFIVFGIHTIYPLVLKRLSRKTDSFASSYNHNLISDTDKLGEKLPFVSVIIPVHNEELVIERRINNIFESSFPKNKLELIVVDSGSMDNTRSIIEEKFPETVILLKEQKRSGKAHAINLALKICKGDIVVITDGPTLYQKDTILQLVSSLRNPYVGGVSALYNVPNADENQVTAAEQKFWSYKDKIRILESKVYSTSWLSGEACAFKKEIVKRIDEDTLADDSNVALQIVSRGYRVVVNENSNFIEKSPSEFYDYIKIKSRRVLGGLIETLRFKFFLFNRKYGRFGLIIFPYRFFTQFITPIALYIAVILSIPAAIELSTNFGSYLVLLIGVCLLILGLLFRNKLIAYLYLLITTSLALWMLLTNKRDVRWAQSRATRQKSEQK